MAGAMRGSTHLSGEGKQVVPREQHSTIHGYQFRKHEIDGISNLILLRSDLHGASDQRKFVFIPKYGQLWMHVLSDLITYRGIYHNARLHDTSLGRELLFDRFTWSIVLQVREDFLANPAGISVAIWVDGSEQVKKWADEAQ